jgi:hypothetical protein
MTTFKKNPPPQIKGYVPIGKGYYYRPGDTVNSEKPKKKKPTNPIDDDKNWIRTPNAPKGKRF